MSTLLTLIICRISDRKHPPCRVLMLQQFAKKCSVLKREKKQMEKEQLCTSLSFVFIISPVSTSDFPKTRGGEPESHGIPDLVGSLEVICPSPTGYRNPSQGAAEISEADTQLCWETVLHGSLMFCISRKQRYPFFFFSFLFFAIPCSRQNFLHQGSNPHHLPWKHEVLATGPPGKSQGTNYLFKDVCKTNRLGN